MLYTAQYRYSGPDRLDITIARAVGLGAIFAPTWMMVRTYKSRATDLQDYDNDYASQYYALLRKRRETHEGAFRMLHEKSVMESVTVVCFCAAGNFCHRCLLCDYMLAEYRTPIGGER